MTVGRSKKHEIESKIKKLMGLFKKLDNPEITLEESVAIYKNAKTLLKKAKEQLIKIEKKLREEE